MVKNCHAWQKINVGIRKALAEVSLADLQLDSEPLQAPDLRRALGGVTDNRSPEVHS